MLNKIYREVSNKYLYLYIYIYNSLKMIQLKCLMKTNKYLEYKNYYNKRI